MLAGRVSLEIFLPLPPQLQFRSLCLRDSLPTELIPQMLGGKEQTLREGN